MGLLSKTKGHTPAAVDRSPQAARPAHTACNAWWRVGSIVCQMIGYVLTKNDGW